ncbi:MAG: hypothetical protein WCP55_13865, partial [Lentisphaerota bacterium]
MKRLDGEPENFGQRRDQVVPAENDIRRCAHQVGSEGKAPIVAFQIESVRGAGQRGQEEHLE